MVLVFICVGNQVGTFISGFGGLTIDEEEWSYRDRINVSSE